MHSESPPSPRQTTRLAEWGQTEVVGQDGISYSPVNNRKELRAIRDQIAGWNGNPTDEECETTLAGIGMFEWKTVGEYLDCLERNRTATNVAMLVPQVRFSLNLHLHLRLIRPLIIIDSRGTSVYSLVDHTTRKRPPRRWRNR